MSSRKAPIWPLIAAPFIGVAYYLALNIAFLQSVIPIAGRTDFFEAPHWGQHWVLRLVAEAMSIALGSYVASSLAKGREHAAAALAGSIIVLGSMTWIVATFYFTPPAPEPWYQHLIDALLIPGTFVIGRYSAEAAAEENRAGLGALLGIHPIHILWLWGAVYFYGLGLITPLARLYSIEDPNIFKVIFSLIINGVPAASLLIPAHYGLAFLSGTHGKSTKPLFRNAIGLIILIIGFAIGAAIQIGWYMLVVKIYAAIFT